MPPKSGQAAGAAAKPGDAPAGDATPHDETSVRQSQMIASTFANVELHSTRATLAQYVSLYNASREEVMRLQHDLGERDKDAMTVVQFLRADLDGRQEQIKALKKQVIDDVKAAETRAEEQKAELMGTIRERDDNIAEMQEKIDGLTADLDALHAFRRERERMHIELSKLKDDHQRMIEQYEAELSKQRFLSLEEKVRLKAEERSMEEKFEAEVHERAMKLLDSKTKEINAENFMLLADKATLERELHKALEAYQRVNAKAEEQQRECDLARLADSEHVKRSVAKGREARELQQRCTDLETSIASLVKQHKDALESQHRELTDRVVAAERDRDDAMRTAELIQRDYLKMRQLTKSVVKQRTELETFFNEALDFVRNEIDRERKSAAIAQRQANLEAIAYHAARNTGAVGATNNAGSATLLPRITQGPGAASSAPAARGAAARAARRNEGSNTLNSSVPGKGAATAAYDARSGAAPGGGGPGRSSSSTAVADHADPTTDEDGEFVAVPRVDISDLAWHDKERVLRILFAKINAVTTGSAAAAPKGTSSVPRLPAIEQRADTSSSVFMTNKGA